VIDEFGIDEQRETGFGTGLRAHLSREVPLPAGPPVPGPEPPAELEQVRWEGDPEPVPEPSSADERARELRAYASELAERERRLAELERELAEESQRLAAVDAVRTAPRRPVRELLREHAEDQAERLVLTFEQALEATDHDGRPDFSTRLTALRLLLDEAYREPAGDAAGSSRVEDELAELRRRRGLA
jgi:hypothetical protein